MKECQRKISQKNNIHKKQEGSERPCCNTFSFYKCIPNLLTTLRLLGTPLCAWFIAQDQLVFAFWVFFAVSMTDWLDGYLARLWQATSKLGQILDPIADKFLIISVYLTLGLWKYIPFWLVSLVLLRDLLILLSSSGIIFATKIKLDFAPSLIGKVSTAIQMLFVGLVLARGVPISSFPTSSIGNNLMVLFLYKVALLTILSGLTYAHVAINAFRKS